MKARGLAKDTAGQFTVPVEFDDPDAGCPGCGGRHNILALRLQCVEGKLAETRAQLAAVDVDRADLHRLRKDEVARQASFAQHQANSAAYDTTRGHLAKRRA